MTLSCRHTCLLAHISLLIRKANFTLVFYNTVCVWVCYLLNLIRYINKIKKSVCICDIWGLINSKNSSVKSAKMDGGWCTVSKIKKGKMKQHMFVEKVVVINYETVSPDGLRHHILVDEYLGCVGNNPKKEKCAMRCCYCCCSCGNDDDDDICGNWTLIPDIQAKFINPAITFLQ